MTWSVIDHACRFCFGRVLASDERGIAGAARHRCAQCGHVEEGHYAALCCCGVRVGSRQILECSRNERQVPRGNGVAEPEVVVRQKEVASEKVLTQLRIPRPVGSGATG